ncbi:ferredoxin [Bradyrhizobium sp. i1.8.4]|uniref:2Fe-2S iron-sulfur cluster-binding protein n=1 Tax=unclassified Bradyrhizobium TaxID=2631580 RepID=UPI003D21DD22
MPSREQAVYLDVLAPLLNEWLSVDAGNEGRRLDFDNLFASLPTESFRARLVDWAVGIEIPRDRSLLEVLGEAGYEVIADCRRGACGVCAIELVNVDGEVDHRDVFNEQQKRANEKDLCLCLSRPRHYHNRYPVPTGRVIRCCFSAAGSDPAPGRITHVPRLRPANNVRMIAG